MNRLNATLAIALVSLLSLTACGEEAKNAAEGTKDTAKTATDGAMKAGGDAMKAGGDAMKAGADGAKKAGEAAKDTVTGAADKATGAMSLMSLKDSIPELKNSASAALTAVKAGDFKTAQAEVTKLQESWNSVSEIVKKHSSGDFSKINTTLKTVQTELKAPSPDKGKIVADLQSLSTEVQGLVALK